MTHHDPTPAGRHARRRPAPWVWLLALPLALLLVVAAVFLFVPVDSLRGTVERQFSRATGYQVTIGRLNLHLVGMGLGLAAGDFRAISRDGSQSITVPELGMGVRLIPLFSRRVEITLVEAPDLEFRMGAAGSMGKAAATPPAAQEHGASSTLEAPDIRIHKGRIVHAGTNGITRISDITLQGGFRTTATGGAFEGDVRADSLSFAPAASPNAPLTLPRFEARFHSDIDTRAVSASSTLEGKVGTIPARGSVESVSTGGHWGTRGTSHSSRSASTT
ncbi:MAG TPA: hypothetical protein VF720_01160 [Candidatus Eisenbacteria bacterium]